MKGKLGKKAAILLIAGLFTGAGSVARADHDIDVVTPLVTLFAVGALLNYDHASHHYHHYYRYRRYDHGGGHYPRHGYHGRKQYSHGYYGRRQSSHGHYAQPRRRSSGHGGYRRH